MSKHENKKDPYILKKKKKKGLFKRALSKLLNKNRTQAELKAIESRASALENLIKKHDKQGFKYQIRIIN